MSLPRLSRRQQAGLAVALAILLWAPTTLSHGDVPVVTGHSTFYDGDTFSPCLGSIAGIMRHRVMWFNNQVLAETYGGTGTFIWVTEQGAPDPRKERELYTEGVFYDFVDPNGAHWHVEELFYDIVTETNVVAGVDQTGAYPEPYVKNASLAKQRTMVWVVELAPRPIFDEFAGADPHTYYNFLVLVDTCKLGFNDVPNPPWIENHDTAEELSDKHGHENGEDAHTHEAYMMDIWVGKRPTAVIPYGVSVDGAEWTTEWAYQESAGTANEQSGGAYGYATEEAADDATGDQSTLGDLAP